MTTHKRHYELAVKKSVSMPEILLDQAEDRRRRLRFTTFSDYIQHLIRNDTTDYKEGDAIAA